MQLNEPLMELLLITATTTINRMQEMQIITCLHSPDKYNESSLTDFFHCKMILHFVD